MSLRTSLGRARGLGSAKEGVQHWWMQRMSALALVPLCIWFVISLLTMIGADYERFADWLASPLVGGLMVLLIVALFYHLKLGVQVVIEDYVHTHATKIGLIVLVNGACYVLALASILAVLSFVFGG